MRDHVREHFLLGGVELCVELSGTGEANNRLADLAHGQICGGAEAIIEGALRENGDEMIRKEIVAKVGAINALVGYLARGTVGNIECGNALATLLRPPINLSDDNILVGEDDSDKLLSICNNILANQAESREPIFTSKTTGLIMAALGRSERRVERELRYGEEDGFQYQEVRRVCIELRKRLNAEIVRMLIHEDTNAC